MGNHRANVGETRPSVTPETPQPYVGKRRAATVIDESAELTRPAYVGKRRAALPPAEEMPVQVTRTRDDHETTADPRIDTSELRAIVEGDLQITAPLPRSEARTERVEVPEALAVPGPRLAMERTPAEEAAEAVGLAAPVSIDDSAIDLPRISVAATYAADLSADTTASLPVVPAEGRRAEVHTRRRVKSRRLPLPVAVGAAAITVAAIGAGATVGVAQPADEAVRTTSASALTGESAIGASLPDDREISTSRDRDRSAAPAEADADQLADQRAAALDQLEAQATGQDKLLEENRWVLPVDNYRITNTFGLARSYYSSGAHTGLDFAAPTGTPIKSVARGTVTSVGWAGAYGNQTIVTLEDGTEIWYCHQTSYAVNVGDEVNAGDVIGYVGSTGNSTGPHLHLEVRPGGGDPVDPAAALEQQGLTP